MHLRSRPAGAPLYATGRMGATGHKHANQSSPGRHSLGDEGIVSNKQPTQKVGKARAYADERALANWFQRPTAVPPPVWHQLFTAMGTCPGALSRRSSNFLHATNLTVKPEEVNYAP